MNTHAPAASPPRQTPPAERVGVSRRGAHRRSPLLGREAGLAGLVLVAAAGLAVVEPRFLTASNLVSVGNGMIYDLPVAVGMTLVLLLGGIDLSVGAVVGLTAVITTLLLRAGAPIVLAILLGFAAAAGVGTLNGLLVARLALAPFIVTLGTMSVARGTATVLTSGYFLSGLPAWYVAIGRSQLLGIPLPIFIVAAILGASHALLTRWKPLHDAFYAGCNPAAAYLSGIDVRRLVCAGYVVSALLAAVSALFMTARLGMGYARFGEMAELRAIAAAVLGGASFGGGTGSIVGTVLGVVLLAIILNGFVLLNLSVYWQGVASGAILVVAVAVDAIRRHRYEAR